MKMWLLILKILKKNWGHPTSAVEFITPSAIFVQQQLHVTPWLSILKIMTTMQGKLLVSEQNKCTYMTKFDYTCNQLLRNSGWSYCKTGRCTSEICVFFTVMFQKSWKKKASLNFNVKKIQTDGQTTRRNYG